MGLLRKIKEGLKQISKTKEPAKAKKISSGKIRGKEAAQKDEKQVFGGQEMSVQQTKFYTGQHYRAQRHDLKELPEQYGQDKIILQVRDPWWLHTYWEVGGNTWERIKSELHEEFSRAKRLLRVYDISNIIFNGKNAHRFFDIQVSDYANNWYIDTAGPGRSWCVDLGLLLSDGRFITIVRSNTVSTPLDGPSWITDEEWMIPDDMFARLYGMGFGLGRSSPIGKAWQERVKGVLSSPGIASMASPVKKKKERKFWLWVNTELIVYGATEPDAKVSVQGKEINLRPDGTFSLRFALPDGKQVIPVSAQASDKLEERTITPIVARETK